MKKLLALLAVFSIILTGCGTQKSDWASIQSKGEMVIGITYFAPMNYLNDENELIGFETEFAKAVCERLGVEAVFQVIDWDSKETELKSRNIDCIWNGMTITEERKENIDFSVSYMQNRPIVVARKGEVPSLQNARIAAEKGSTGEELVLTDTLFANSEYTAVDTQIKAFLEVKSGTADFAVTDYLVGIGALGEGSDFSNLVIAPYSFESEQYGIGFRKNSDIVAKVNAAIAELKANGTLQTIANKYKLGELLL